MREVRGHLHLGVRNIDKREAVVSGRPDHGKGGETFLGDLELMARMMAAVLLCGAKHETKGGFENIEISRVEELVEMLKGAVELAVGAVLDEQTGEAEDAKDETLGERREVVDLDLGKLVVATDVFEDGIEAVEHAGPVVKIASRPAPFGDAVEHGRQLIVG